jgi:acetyl-CoA C-acetyltransferase
MTSHGIADKVAIVAMGCTRFGERWDSSVDDLLLETTRECFESVRGLTKDDVDAYWLGTLGSGQSGLTLSRALGTEDKPVTRVEN